MDFCYGSEGSGGCGGVDCADERSPSHLTRCETPLIWVSFPRGKTVGGGGKMVVSCVGPCKVLRERGNGGSISLCVGIQAKLLIVDDVMNGGLFFFVIVTFFSEKK